MIAISSDQETWEQRGCGAVLITPRIVLSAAHCDHELLHGVVVNTTVVKPITSAAQFVKIKRKILHPSYDEVTGDYDFMLLELEGGVAQRFWPFQIPLATAAYIGALGASTKLVTCGHGREFEGGPGSDHLSCLEVPYQPTCGHIRFRYHYDNKTMICAGDTGKTACKGDSGGPLYHRANGEWILLGVASWGVGCGKRSLPTVFARVSSIIDWLKATGAADLKTRGAAGPPSPAPAPPAAAPWLPPTAAEQRLQLLDTHNRLRCLHWGSAGSPWAANVSWSEDLAARAEADIRALTSSLRSGRRLQSTWGLDDDGAVAFTVADSQPSLEALHLRLVRTYLLGKYETAGAAGEVVAQSADEFYEMVSRGTLQWQVMRRYVDIVWRGAGRVGCAWRRVALRGSGTAMAFACIYGATSRKEGTPAIAWQGIQLKAQLRRVTTDTSLAQACGMDASDVTQQKSQLDVGAAMAGDVGAGDSGAVVKDVSARRVAGPAGLAMAMAALVCAA